MELRFVDRNVQGHMIRKKLTNSTTGAAKQIEKNITTFLAANKRKHREENVIFVNLAWLDIPKITSHNTRFLKNYILCASRCGMETLAFRICTLFEILETSTDKLFWKGREWLDRCLLF